MGTTTTAMTSTTNAPMNTGIIISGGGSASNTVEVFIPGSGLGCTLPDLPNDRFGHSMDGLVLCGGGYSNIGTNCLSFTSGQWNTSHTLLHSRYCHSSWMSEEGLVLIGGRGSPTTTELLQDSNSVPYFDLKYRTRYTCSIPDPATNTVILTGGLETRTSPIVSRYGKDHGYVQSTEILVGSSAAWAVTANLPT